MTCCAWSSSNHTHSSGTRTTPRSTSRRSVCLSTQYVRPAHGIAVRQVPTRALGPGKVRFVPHALPRYAITSRRCQNGTRDFGFPVSLRYVAPEEKFPAEWWHPSDNKVPHIYSGVYTDLTTSLRYISRMSLSRIPGRQWRSLSTRASRPALALGI
jgi:hypothetical protein